MTNPTFAEWLTTAKPKAEYRYHTGSNLIGGKGIDAVRIAYNAGLVTLAQRRNAAGSFDYLAIRNGRADKPEYPFIFDQA